MIQWYALVLSCFGVCPANLPPPDGFILFKSMAECRTHLIKIAPKNVYGPDGKVLTGTHMRDHCARVYVDPSWWDQSWIKK